MDDAALKTFQGLDPGRFRRVLELSFTSKPLRTGLYESQCRIRLAPEARKDDSELVIDFWRVSSFLMPPRNVIELHGPLQIEFIGAPESLWSAVYRVRDAEQKGFELTCHDFLAEVRKQGIGARR